MKKELESWLRGETPQPAEALSADAPVAGEPVIAANLRLPVVALMVDHEESPPTANIANDLPSDVSSEPAEENVSPEPQTRAVTTEEAAGGAESSLPEEPAAAEDISHDGFETEREAAVPDQESEEEAADEKNDGKDYDAENEKPSAAETPEEAASRMEMRLKQMKEMQRAAYMYEQGDDFRMNRRRRVFALCAIAAVAIAAVTLLYRSIRGGSGSYDTMMSKARGLYEQEQYTASFEAYNEASLEYDDRAEPFLGVGRAAERMGRVDDSLAAYRSYLERLPDDAARSRSSVFYEIGRLYAALKAWENAQSSFEEAITADASNYGAHFELGNSLEEQAQLDKALLAYRQALLISPSSDAAMEAVQRVSFVLDSKDEIEEKYGQALSSGDTALKDKRYGEASKYFAEALAIRSDDADAWVGFAEARAKLGDSGGAVKSLERALERDPEHGPAKSKLAEMEAQNKKNTPPRRRNNSSSRQGSSSRSEAKNVAAKTQTASSRKALFDAGVELYRSEDYARAFDSFIACLRSAEKELLPLVSLAGEQGPVWKGTQVRLNVPLNAKLLAESVRLNPEDRELYVNLSMAASKMALNRQAMHSTMKEAHSHALMIAGTNNN